MNLDKLLDKHPKIAVYLISLNAIKDSKMRTSTVIILITFIFGTPIAMLAHFAQIMLG